MKLLTINTHSLLEAEFDKKADIFADAVAEELPDVIALQEVNQSAAADIRDCPFEICGYKTRVDNYAAVLLDKLGKRSVKYYGIWLPVKRGYERYDEGLAVFSRFPVLETSNILVSEHDDYSDWRTRRALGIRNEFGWFYSVHMGWWNDEKEPFESQWRRLEKPLTGKERVWLMGDFNNRADIENEGYTLVIKSGWHDAYRLAKNKDCGFTVDKKIDGWKETQKMRIDYIFSNFKAEIEKSQVIFNGENRDIVSDHYGVMIETKE
jgi:maltose 6'-phosphate phosphatase